MARSTELRVAISGDASKLNKELREVDGRTARTGKSFDRLKGAALGAGTAMAGGLVVGLGASVRAAIEAEKSQARLQAQLKASGISYRDHAKEIDRVIQATSRLSGLDDEDLQDSFTNIVRVTGDVNKSLRLNGLAADFARAKQIGVAKAGEIVGKVAGGNTGILSRYGIKIKEGATASEALAEMQKRFAGQAKAYGKTTEGALDRMKVSGENLAETVGEALAPSLAEAADKVAKFTTEMQTGKGAGGRFVKTLEDIKDAVAPVVRFFKDHPKLIAVAVGAWATYRVASGLALTATRISDFRKAFGKGKGVAAAEGAIAGRTYAASSATAANTTVGRQSARWQRIGGRMGRMMGLGLAAAIPVAIIANRKAIQDAIEAITPDWLDPWKDDQAGSSAPRARGRGLGRSGMSDRAREGDARDPQGSAPSRGQQQRSPGSTRPMAGASRRIAGVAVASTSRATARASHSGGGGAPPLAAFMGQKFGLRFTDGWRPQNAGYGAANSWHKRGSPSRPGAIDQVGSNAAMQAALAWAQANISGLAEAMIHDAGSGFHLHLGGPGVMNWNGSGGGTGVGTTGGGGSSRGSTGSTGSAGGSRGAVGATPRRTGPTVAGTIRATQRTAAARARADAQKAREFRATEAQTTQYDLDLASIDVREAAGGPTDVTRFERAFALRQRADKIRKALKKKGVRRATRLRLTQELAQITGDMRDLAPEAPEAAEAAAAPEMAPPPTAGDWIDAEIAQASLTAGTDDDKASLAKLVDLRRQQLADAEASLDPRLVTEAAGNLKSATDALDALRGSLDDVTRGLAEEMKSLTAELKRQTDFAESVNTVSRREFGGALTDIISGEIVGRNLQGRRQTAGTGTMVRIP